MAVLPNAVLPGNSLGGSLGQDIGLAVSSSALGSVGLSQASTRQNVASMYSYSTKTVGPTPNFIFPDASTDWRVRISLAPNATYFYNDSNNNLLSPLVTEPGISGGVNAIAGALGQLTGLSGARRVGVVFPYTPQLSITHTANYSPQKLTHNNYTNYFYENSEVQAISITANFTVQSIDEGQYLLATLYFFRSLTKMFFGMDPQAGNPPPLVYLNGYGQYYLPNVPCVVTSFAHTMPGDVDYMDIPEPYATRTGYNPQLMNRRMNSTRLPTDSQITLSLQPVYSRKAQSGGFSLEDFARGALVNSAGAGKPASSYGASQAPKYAPGGLTGGFL